MIKKEVNIIGNGYMGSQVSSLLCLLGYKVNIFYNNNKNENFFFNNLRILSKKLSLNDRKIEYEFNDNMNNLKNYPTIECVSENLDVKKKIFSKIFQHVENNVFSNTSSINVNKINKNISILHFMNPIFLGIVEIFKKKNVDQSGNELIKSLSLKNFIIINNTTPEDIVLNKIIFSEISEFFHLIEVQKIDKIELLNSINKIKRYNFLQTLDLIGLDTCLKIMENLYQINQNFYIPKVFKIALKNNILGKKNKKSINTIFLSNNYPDLST